MQGIRHSFLPSSSFSQSAPLICAGTGMFIFCLAASTAPCTADAAVEFKIDAASDALSMAAFCSMLPPGASEVCDAEKSGCASNQLVWKS